MSILLDTNVLSELLRERPEAAVPAWFGMQQNHTLFVSAVTQAEMLLGARLLPAGKRRLALERAIGAMFDEDFGGRILPFESGTVHAYAEIVSARRAAGKPIAQFDAQIAAIARQHGARLATRNVADFHRCGVTLVNPWSAIR